MKESRDSKDSNVLTKVENMQKYINALKEVVGTQLQVKFQNNIRAEELGVIGGWRDTNWSDLLKWLERFHSLCPAAKGIEQSLGEISDNQVLVPKENATATAIQRMADILDSSHTEDPRIAEDEKMLLERYQDTDNKSDDAWKNAMKNYNKACRSIAEEFGENRRALKQQRILEDEAEERKRRSRAVEQNYRTAIGRLFTGFSNTFYCGPECVSRAAHRAICSISGCDSIYHTGRCNNPACYLFQATEQPVVPGQVQAPASGALVSAASSASPVNPPAQ